MKFFCTPEKPLLQVLPIIQVSSVLKELPVLSLIVLVRAFSEKVCPGHKVCPMSTDPVLLISMYSKLQIVNKVFLDSRLGPTLSCLVAEKC